MTCNLHKDSSRRPNVITVYKPMPSLNMALVSMILTVAHMAASKNLDEIALKEVIMVHRPCWDCSRIWHMALGLYWKGLGLLIHACF